MERRRLGSVPLHPWHAIALAAWLALPLTARAARPWTELPPASATPAALPELSALVRRAMPAVVSIEVEQRAAAAGGDALDELLRRFGDDAPADGIGAGFVIHASGLVVTNQHVVENQRAITVVLLDGGQERRLPARLVGEDRATDVALLRVDAGHPLPCLPLGDSDRLDVADWVVAIGNPFGLSRTVTFGIVSQKGRTDVSPQGREGYFDFIQTDASMNPGSSGGPLLNLRGEVVAINNAINAAGQGIGFAVPINMAKKVLPQLAEHGVVTRAWLGASVRDAPGARGVMVSEVAPSGPAALAGLQAGDVIVGLGDALAPTAGRLRWEIACAPAGTVVTLRVLREGRTMRLSARLRPEPP